MKRKKPSRAETQTADDQKRIEELPADANRIRIAKDDVASEQGTEAATGGQSGDLQDLPRDADADSESVAELIEEGQSFEAGIVSGVEDAPNADEGEIRTREV